MKKDKKGIIVIAILSVIIIAIRGVLILKNVNNEKYLKEITYTELKEKMLNEETFILYIGKENCSACQAFNPTFKSVINKYKIEVFYIDLETLKDEEKTELTNTVSFTGTPTVAFIEKGKDSLNSDTKIVGNIAENKIITKLKNRGYIK